MAFRFEGGPLDGKSFSHDQIHAFAQLSSVPTNSGNTLLLHVPSLRACETILRGEMSKGAETGPLATYERMVLPGGGILFREISDESLKRLFSAHNGSNPEAAERSRDFAHLAERFAVQLRGAEIGGATEVAILYYCEDQRGHPLPAVRRLISPRTTVTVPGNRDLARKWAEDLHRNDLIANLDTAVRRMPTEYFRFPERPDVNIRIVKIVLEIVQP